MGRNVASYWYTVETSMGAKTVRSQLAIWLLSVYNALVASWLWLLRPRFIVESSDLFIGDHFTDKYNAAHNHISVNLYIFKIFSTECLSTNQQVSVQYTPIQLRLIHIATVMNVCNWNCLPICSGVRSGKKSWMMKGRTGANTATPATDAPIHWGTFACI